MAAKSVADELFVCFHMDFVSLTINNPVRCHFMSANELCLSGLTDS